MRRVTTVYRNLIKHHEMEHFIYISCIKRSTCVHSAAISPSSRQYVQSAYNSLDGNGIRAPLQLRTIYRPPERYLYNQLRGFFFINDKITSYFASNRRNINSVYLFLKCFLMKRRKPLC